MTTVYGGDGTNGVFAGGSGNSNNPNDRHQRWGPAYFGYDRTNRLVVAYSYELPSWKNGNSFERVATGGWKVSGSSTFQSGKPLTFTDSRNGTGWGTTASRAQFLPGMGNSNIINKSGGSMINRVRNNTYLNPAANVFGLAPLIPNEAKNGTVDAYDFGNSAIGAVRGPGNDNWDMAIIKTTRVGGIRESALPLTSWHRILQRVESPGILCSGNCSECGDLQSDSQLCRFSAFDPVCGEVFVLKAEITRRSERLVKDIRAILLLPFKSMCQRGSMRPTFLISALLLSGCLPLRAQDHTLLATSKTVSWGHYGGQKAALTVKSGETVKIQTLSTLRPKRQVGGARHKA